MTAVLPACSTNPATGARQFTALMSPAQESQIGAQENEKVMQTFGAPPDSAALGAYVQKIGAAVSQKTERPEVQYKFTLIDSDMVNAFAIPGGYIYVSRGLLALANSEAELAAVLAHETGHITARHSAERYSHGVLTSLGAAALSIALDSQAATQALGLGSDLYIKSYSRSQENEADALGLRYIARAGYDPFAMPRFLTALDADTALERRLAGQGEDAPFNYFSTHPGTNERIAHTAGLAGSYPKGPDRVGRDAYLDQIDGMIYGESPKQGYVRGRDYYHTTMGFTFRVPEGFQMTNAPDKIVATAGNGAVILFDAALNPQALDPLTYLTRVWMTKAPLSDAERITINGMEAATASFPGNLNGRAVTIRLVAVRWAPDRFFRFQMAIPDGAGVALAEDLRRTTYSLRALSATEKKDIQPYRIRIVTAKTGDTPGSLARRMPFDTLQEARFRVLNGLSPTDKLIVGRRYKIVE